MIGPPDPVMRFFGRVFTWDWQFDARALMFAAIVTGLIGAFIGMYFYEHAFDEE